MTQPFGDLLAHQLQTVSPADSDYAPRAVDAVLAVAHDTGATDIHLQPNGAGLEVKFRVDGVLLHGAVFPRQQRPMVEGIASLAGSYPKSKIRRLLSSAQRDVEAGCDWVDALGRRGLIRRADRALLQAAQRVGNLPWAMQEAADSNRRRFVCRLQAIVQAAFPPIIISFGLIVMFIAVAIFLPLVEMIKRLA